MLNGIDVVGDSKIRMNRKDNSNNSLLLQATCIDSVNNCSNNICGNPISTIKGEIHNVLSVIQSNDILSSHSSTFRHPSLVTRFRELNDFLNSVVSTMTSSSANMILESLDATTYVTPFATAITSTECNATITGAALSSLTKFVLYGFVSTTQHPCAVEGLTLMAKCVRYCSFEETSPEDHKKKIKQQQVQTIGTRKIITTATATKNNNNTSNNNQTTSKGTQHLLLKSFYSSSSNKSKTARTNNTNKNRNSDVWSDNASDEQVVLKLVSLASLIVRCPVSIYLHPSDIVGLFDTCLFIAQQPTASALLRGAAGDSMAHIVLVAFGRAAAAADNANSNTATSSIAAYATTNATGAIQSLKDQKDYVNDRIAAGSETIENPAGINNENNEEEEPLLKWPSMDSDSEDEAPKPPQNQRHERQHLSNGGTRDQFISDATNGTTTAAAATTTSPTTCSPAIVTILHTLSLLADPHSSNCVQLALMLINIALETMSTRLNAYQEIIPILQNTLSKHLLQLAGTTQNAQIFSVTLRVIFNLFNSLKNHLKVQLEVFLTSVHLRVLLNDKKQEEEHQRMKELALTSLVEFCNEPALMMDLYYNYDCDVHCSNLFEIVCTTIASQAKTTTKTAALSSSSKLSKDPPSTTEMSALQRLAFEGILAVIEGIARRCSVKQVGLHQHQQHWTSAPQSNSSSVSFGGEDSKSSSLNDGTYNSVTSNNKSSMLSPIDPYVLQKRKQKKRSLALVAAQFNKNPFADWIQYALLLNIFDNEATSMSYAGAKAVAIFLFNTPHLDKVQMGLYLSKGPKDKYPFNDEVLQEFASLFDFTATISESKVGAPKTLIVGDGFIPVAEEGPESSCKNTQYVITPSIENTLDFSDALRTFLKKFRLPGEAQCIDRLMEAFARRVYECAAHSWRSVFKSSDAIFILAFSTIMLNTDLHNPNIDDAKRMTADQFIRNNSGINDGENLPEEFLWNLYYRIKTDEIRMQQELSDVMDVNGECMMSNPAGTQQQWDGILSNASQTPFFTTSDFPESGFPHSLQQSGAHKNDMFSCIAQSALQCISSIVDDDSADDAVIVRAIQGFRQMAGISIYFDMLGIFNEILEILLSKGENYIDQVSCGALNLDDALDGEHEENPSGKEFETASNSPRDDTLKVVPTLLNQPLSPHSLTLVSSKATLQLHDRDQAIAGSSLHRGLLGLQCAFSLIRLHTSSVSLTTWRSLISCICKMRDINAIPINLADLDDFGDSRGVPFAASRFSRRSKQRLNNYLRRKHINDNETFRPVEGGGLWGDFLTVIAPLPDSKKLRESSDIDDEASNLDEETFLYKEAGISPYILEAMHAVTQAALFDQFMIRFKDWKSCNQIITALLESADPVIGGEGEKVDEWALFEQHAVFTLELAARALLANRNRALELYPLLQKKLYCILTVQTDSLQTDSPHFPYLMERALVTVLRACIHLFDIPLLQEQLIDSLLLLNQLPDSFIVEVSDRLACGMAIILRVSYHQLTKDNDWELLGSLLDKAARSAKGWRLVLDGIASFIEQHLRPTSPDSLEDISECTVPSKGVIVLADILLNFMTGIYPSAPALTEGLSILESLCSFAMFRNSPGCPISVATSMLPLDLWERVVFAFYHIFAVSEHEVSRQAMESLLRITLTVKVDSVSQSTWMALLDLVLNKQPQLEDFDRRVRATDFLGKVLLMTVPELSKRKDNWWDLAALVTKSAIFVSENLQAGRKNIRVSTLFESTVQIATNLSNVFYFLGESESGQSEFVTWAGETLLVELEKAGAAGGSIRTSRAILKAKGEVTPVDVINGGYDSAHDRSREQ